MAGAIELGGGEVRSIPVRVKAQGKARTYHVPLRGSLRMADIVLLRKVGEDGEANMMLYYEFFCRYVPQEAIDSLTEDEFISLFRQWDAASDEDGVTEGE